jgi:hypothetical protein
MLSVQSSLKWARKKDSGMDFNKHKCVFFPEVAWFLEMSYVESKKRKGFHLNTPKITAPCNYIVINLIVLYILITTLVYIQQIVCV